MLLLNSICNPNSRQELFFSNLSTGGKIIRYQTFFLKKQAFKGIYYDNLGREEISWRKKNRYLFTDQSRVAITKYEGGAVNNAFGLETYDDFGRILEVDGAREKTVFEYVGPNTELRHMYGFNRKGEEKLINTFEVNKSFYN